MQCFPFALDLQNLPLLNFKTGNLERLPNDKLRLQSGLVSTSKAEGHWGSLVQEWEKPITGFAEFLLS